MDGHHPRNGNCLTMVDLIFVTTVNIPNLNLLPCLEVVKTIFWTHRRTEKVTYWCRFAAKKEYENFVHECKKSPQNTKIAGKLDLVIQKGFTGNIF